VDRVDPATLYAKVGTDHLETLLTATAASEDFQRAMDQAASAATATPEDLEKLKRRIEERVEDVTDEMVACEVPDGPGASLPWPTLLVAPEVGQLTFHSASTHDARYRDADGNEVLVYPQTTLGSLADRRPLLADLRPI
jgi:hypothetical protein